MTSYVANKDSTWNDTTMFTPNGEPTTGDDVDLLTYKATLPVDYAGKCRSLTGGVGSELIYSAGSSMTIDDTVSIDYSPETVTMSGTQAKPPLCTSAAVGEPTNKIPAGMTNLVSTYGKHEHMAALLKASSLTLTDSEYWFYVGTSPEEQIVAGTWVITRSLIASYGRDEWYIKPTGTLTIDFSLLARCLPTIYSANYYIVFYQGADRLTKVPRPKIEAESAFLGGIGEYTELTGFMSEKVEVAGRVTYDDLTLWNHPLDHKIFTAMLEELNRDQDEIVKFTWNEGHFSEATMKDYRPEQYRGEGSIAASRTFTFIMKERPYN